MNQNARPIDYSDDMDEDMITDNTLSKKQLAMSNGTKSIMRPSRKSAEEHSKSRAKMLAVANAASKNGTSYYRNIRLGLFLEDNSLH